MSDITGDTSSESSNDTVEHESDLSEGDLEISGQIEPYEYEPLASSNEAQTSESEEEADIDGLTLAILARRFEKEVPVREW